MTIYIGSTLNFAIGIPLLAALKGVPNRGLNPDMSTGAQIRRLWHWSTFRKSLKMLDFIGHPDGHPGRSRWPMEQVFNVAPEEIIESIL